MIIKELYIKSFAGLSEKRYVFEDGIVVVEGPNESGKSRIAAFIKFMFYGLNGREHGVTFTEKQRYVTWTDGSASGSMVLISGGKTLRIEREFLVMESRTVKDTVQMVDVLDNTVILKQGCPGEYLFGVGENVFVQTAFVNQLDVKVDRDSIGEIIENIMFAADEDVSVSKAMKKLDEARVSLLYKNKKGGELYTLSEEISDMEKRLAEVQEYNAELIAKEGAVRECEKKVEVGQKRLLELESELERYEKLCLLEKVQRKKEYQKELEVLHAKMSELSQSLGKDGFVPDNAYIRRLTELAEEIGRIDRKTEILEAKIQELLAQRKETELTEKAAAPINDYEKRKIVSDAVICDTKRKNYSIFGYVLGFFTGLAIVATAIVCFFNITFALPMFFGSCVLLLVSILMFVSAKSQGRHLIEILDCYGASDLQDLSDKLEDRIGEREIDSGLLQRIEICENEQKDLCEQRELRVAEGEEKLSRLKISCPEEDRIEKRLVFAADSLNRFGETFNDYKRQYEKIADKYENAMTDLKGVQEESLLLQIPEEEQGKILDKEEMDAKKREYNFLVKANEALIEKKHELEKRLSALYAMVESPGKLYDRLSEKKARREECTKRYEAYLLAYEKLNSAGKVVRESVSPRLSAAASEFFSKVSDGKYESLGMDVDMALSFYDGSMTRSLQFLSAGTRDAAYLCLRMALIGMLFEKNKPTAVFDESFIKMDENRTKNMLRMLGEQVQTKGGQMILLTCSTREEVLLSQLGIHYTYIHL